MSLMIPLKLSLLPEVFNAYLNRIELAKLGKFDTDNNLYPQLFYCGRSDQMP